MVGEGQVPHYGVHSDQPAELTNLINIGMNRWEEIKQERGERRRGDGRFGGQWGMGGGGRGGDGGIC